MPSTSGSWTFADRLMDLRHRLGLVRSGSKTKFAEALGVERARYSTWELGRSTPDDSVVRECVSRLGLAEEQELLSYLLDKSGTVAPPSWWSASGPVPRVGDPPRDPRWTSEPAKPGDRPRLSPGDAQALAVEAQRAVAEAARPLLRRGAAPVPSPVTPGPVPWGRLAGLVARAMEAREAGDEPALGALAEQLRALVCGSAAVPA